MSPPACITGAEANKITKEPFVVYLSGVDNRGELTEKARSDVNILAVVNPDHQAGGPHQHPARLLC